MIEPKQVLMSREAIPCELTTADLPPKTEWMIAPRSYTNQHYGAYRRVYQVSNDVMEWVPLRGSFPTVEDAQAAVREFMATIQPVFLDEQGNVVGVR